MDIGNVCIINGMLCVISELEDFDIDVRNGIAMTENFIYEAITFDGNTMTTNCPVFIAKNIEEYIYSLTNFDPDEIMR